MKQGGFPVAINLEPQQEETLRYVEVIPVPSDCQLYAILS